MDYWRLLVILALNSLFLCLTLIYFIHLLKQHASSDLGIELFVSLSNLYILHSSENNLASFSAIYN